MELVKYDNIENFVNENMNLILEKEWLNCLMVGNCLDGMKEKPNDWLLAKVTENSKTELIILYRKPWKLLLYSPTNNKSDELFEFTAKEIYKIDANLLGVNSEKEIANKFAEYYCEISNLNFKTHKPLRILLLTDIEKANLNEELIFRKASISDKPILTKFIKTFYDDIGDKIFTRDLKKGKCISFVYTPEKERGKGYAYNLIYRVSKKALDEGAEYCVLYTDDGNPISNHVYEKIGYKRMVDCEDIEFYK